MLNAKDFGAKGDGISDDTQFLQNAIDIAIKEKRELYLPNGIYLITKPLHAELSNAEQLTIIGEWPTIKAKNGMDSVINLKSYNAKLHLQRINFDANHKANNAINADFNGDEIIFEQITVMYAISDGLNLIGEEAIFTNVVAWENSGNGVNCISCRKITFFSSNFMQNGKSGIVVDGGKNSDNIVLDNTWSEKNKMYGIHITGNVDNTLIQDGWLELNEKDGIRIDGSNTKITGFIILGGFKNPNFGVHLTKNAKDNTIYANLVYGYTDPKYGNILDENGFNQIIENTYMEQFTGKMKHLAVIHFEGK